MSFFDKCLKIGFEVGFSRADSFTELLSTSLLRNQAASPVRPSGQPFPSRVEFSTRLETEAELARVRPSLQVRPRSPAGSAHSHSRRLWTAYEFITLAAPLSASVVELTLFASDSAPSDEQQLHQPPHQAPARPDAVPPNLFRSHQTLPIRRRHHPRLQGHRSDQLRRRRFRQG